MRSKFGLAWVLATLGLFGCEVSPDGGVCQNTFDCDRSGSTSTRDCVVYNRREVPCGSNMNCVCCPRDPATADLVPGCRVGAATDGGVVTDTGVLPEAGPDAPVTTCPMTCGAGTFCNPMTLTCTAVRPAGQRCGAAAECATGYCAQGVCCLTACTGAGVTCDLDEAFRGQCMRVPTDAGAPVDAATPDAATPDAATVDAPGADDAGHDASSADATVAD